jgi:hypothetical protein
MTESDQAAQAAAVFQAFDYGYGEVRRQVQGLTDHEYFWEPVPDCWTVKSVDGRLVADFIPRAEPPPFTTVAWRMWHIAVDCFDSYSQRAFGTSGSGLAEDTFVDTAAEAVEVLERSVDHFIDAMKGHEDLWQPVGPAFGPFAEASHVDLILHTYRELVHHGAEIAMMRDLYRLRV